MIRSNGLWRKQASRCGLLVLSLLCLHAAIPALSADDGIMRIQCSPDGEFYARGATNEADMLNADHSFGIGRGRIPFDRWYYLKRALGYTRIYPADSNYTDPRDRRVYSAWGYGVPMAVPLPANVHYQYNYSSGRQGSRLTPVSRPGN